jgi:hypothetical protein
MPMWSGTDDQWVEPVEFTVWVPADFVRPLEDQDYDSVPTTRLPAPPVEARWVWRQPLPGKGGILVHVHDCEKWSDGPELNLDEALTTLQRSGARACKDCGAAEALLPLL